jgi:hypothetical protein
MSKAATSTSQASNSSGSLEQNQMEAAACDLEKYYEAQIDTASTHLSRTDMVLTVIGRGISLATYLLKMNQLLSDSVGNAIPFLKLVCGIIDVAALILLLSLTSIAFAIKSKQNVLTKIVKIAIPLILIGLLITGFLISGIELTIALFVVLAANKAWDLCRKAIDRLFGDWNSLQKEVTELKDKLNCPDEKLSPEEKLALEKQINEKENELISLRSSVAETVHGLVSNLISISGFVALMFLANPVIGMSVLLGIGIYGALDVLGWNPFRLLANKIFNYPFKAIEMNPVTTQKPSSSVVIEKCFEKGAATEKKSDRDIEMVSIVKVDGKTSDLNDVMKSLNNSKMSHFKSKDSIDTNDAAIRSVIESRMRRAHSDHNSPRVGAA